MKSRTIGIAVLLTAAASALACGSGSAKSSNDAPAPVAPTTAAAPVQTPAVGTIPQDGTFLVPTDVQPGTYKTTVPSDQTLCYWARLSAPDTAQIIDNGTPGAGAQAIVTIKPSDKAFQTQGCGTWTKVG